MQISDSAKWLSLVIVTRKNRMRPFRDFPVNVAVQLPEKLYKNYVHHICLYSHRSLLLFCILLLLLCICFMLSSTNYIVCRDCESDPYSGCVFRTVVKSENLSERAHKCDKHSSYTSLRSGFIGITGFRQSC